MTITKKICLILPLFFTLTLIAIFCLSKLKSAGQSFEVYSQEITGQDSNLHPNDPCGFRIDVKKPVANTHFLEKQRRETFGYQQELSLTQAVQIFNDDLQCYPQQAIFPRLTEGEVVAAIVAGSDYGTKQSWELQKSTLSKIVLEKKMPKGSLLISTGGGRAIDYPLGSDKAFAVEAKGQRIYIFLGLDTRPNNGDEVMKPDQFFLIRKSISGLH
jgi:hypothetical protein